MAQLPIKLSIRPAGVLTVMLITNTIISNPNKEFNNFIPLFISFSTDNINNNLKEKVTHQCSKNSPPPFEKLGKIRN